MRWILSALVSSVFAAESLVGGITSSLPKPNIQVQKPAQSFGEISSTNAQVLGDSAVDDTPIVLTPTIISKPKTKQTAKTKPTAKKPSGVIPKKSSKPNVTIALLGDSMIDTLGPGAPALRDILSKNFPRTNFTIKNFGVGSSNIEYGIQRITSGYTYLGEPFPSVSSIRPDILVIESFGYNPFSFDEGAMDKHWLSLAKAVETAKSSIPGVKIIIGSTITPNWNVFGDGAPGLSFAAEDKRRRVENIKKYLENAVRFAKSEKLPLADAYHPSMDSSGNGKLTYINPGDHIHYSDAGRAFFAQKIASAIVANRMLE